MNDVQICNMALSHVGGHNLIQSLNELNKAARLCKQFYEVARDTTLEAHDWSFARKTVDLTALSDTYAQWSYAYQLPADCLAPRKIYNDTGSNSGTVYDQDTDSYVIIGKIEYEMFTDSTGTQKVLATNKDLANLIYTARVTDPNQYTSTCIDALAYRLAAYLAVPLKGKQNAKVTLMQQFMFTIGQAKAINANSEQKEPDNVNTLTRSRG